MHKIIVTFFLTIGFTSFVQVHSRGPAVAIVTSPIVLGSAYYYMRDQRTHNKPQQLKAFLSGSLIGAMPLVNISFLTFCLADRCIRPMIQLPSVFSSFFDDNQLAIGLYGWSSSIPLAALMYSLHILKNIPK